LSKKIKYQNFELFYRGDLSLLDRPKIAIVGSRRPSQYTKEITATLSNLLSKRYVIVSGGAMGVDAIAHKNAKSTIMVSPAGIDVIYPKINKTLIETIAKYHLVISEYPNNHMPRVYNFVQRNRIVVGISEFLIITQSDMDSGSMRSFEIAQKLGKKVYVIPHKIGQSKGTNYLALTKQAEVIWDIEEFVESVGVVDTYKEVLDYNEAFRLYGDELFEMELLGKVEIKDAKVYFQG